MERVKPKIIGGVLKRYCPKCDDWKHVNSFADPTVRGVCSGCAEVTGQSKKKKKKTAKKKPKIDFNE